MMLQSVTAAPANSPILTAVGKGVQIYGCTADKGWVLQAPEATLYVDGKEVGSHSKGLTWTWKDGSSITGKVVASDRALHADKDIPWLVVRTTRVAGKTGALSTMTEVLRLETQGGVAPPSGCDAAHVGDTARVPYSAKYSFYVSSPDRPGISTASEAEMKVAQTRTPPILMTASGPVQPVHEGDRAIFRIDVINASEKAMDFVLGAAPTFWPQILDSTGREVFQPDDGDGDCTSCDIIRLFPGKKWSTGQRLPAECSLMKPGKYTVTFLRDGRGGIARSNTLAFTVVPR